MLPGAPRGEQLVGRTAISHAALLVPIALVPMLTGEAGLVFTFGAIALGIAYTGFAARFAWTPNDQTARALLFASLAHLPLVLALAVLDPVTGALGAFR
jgi:heme O synthase-like polyprenyltransferase